MPTRDEAASMAQVIEEWWAELQFHTHSFRFLVLEDGSTDATPRILSDLRRELGERLVIKPTRHHGHGQACLAGYRWAEEAGATHILQIDSDGQCDPQYFRSFWALRDDAPVVYGKRVRRDDGFGRVVVSAVLRLVIRVAGARCTDPNVPYRLMRTESVACFVRRIPADFDLANVALAVLLARAHVPERSVPIRFRARLGGRPTARHFAFVGKALKLVRQLRSLGRPPGFASPTDAQTPPRSSGRS